jgi:hypothetical protein
VPFLNLRDLGPEQLQDRELVLSVLQPAGFRPTEHERALRKGLSYNHSVALSRPNKSLELRVELWNNHPELELWLVKRQGFDSPRIRLSIAHEGRLEELLKMIVGFKDRINDKNYREVVRELMERFPTIHADLGEEGGYRQLTTDKDDLGLAGKP